MNDWIAAGDALVALGADRSRLASQPGQAYALCRRAFAGLIEARARLFIVNGKEQADAAIERAFWWAGGHSALQQDWRYGDFSTWMEMRGTHSKVEAKAFGVTFDSRGLVEMGADLSRLGLKQPKPWAGEPETLGEWADRMVAAGVSVRDLRAPLVKASWRGGDAPKTEAAQAALAEAWGRAGRTGPGRPKSA